LLSSHSATSSLLLWFCLCDLRCLTLATQQLAHIRIIADHHHAEDGSGNFPKPSETAKDE
jgi:hypothetical protein